MRFFKCVKLSPLSRADSIIQMLSTEIMQLSLDSELKSIGQISLYFPRFIHSPHSVENMNDLESVACFELLG